MGQKSKEGKRQSRFRRIEEASKEQTFSSWWKSVKAKLDNEQAKFQARKPKK